MSHVVTADIVASVMSVDVEVGQSVDPEQAVIILESMKMEIPVLADVKGKVAEVLVRPGDVVHDGDPMLIVEA